MDSLNIYYNKEERRFLEIITEIQKTIIFQKLSCQINTHTNTILSLKTT